MSTDAGRISADNYIDISELPLVILMLVTATRQSSALSSY